MGATPL